LKSRSSLLKGINNKVARRKKKLPDITNIIKPLETELGAKIFPLTQIPQAVSWAEQGNIAIHENYLSRRRQSYHVISGRKENLLRFCDKIGIPREDIRASEFFRFWHLTWMPPLPPEDPPKRRRRRIRKKKIRVPVKSTPSPSSQG